MNAQWEPTSVMRMPIAITILVITIVHATMAILVMAKPAPVSRIKKRIKKKNEERNEKRRLIFNQILMNV